MELEKVFSHFLNIVPLEHQLSVIIYDSSSL